MMILDFVGVKDTVKLLKMIEDGIISYTSAKKVYDIMWEERKSLFLSLMKERLEKENVEYNSQH